MNALSQALGVRDFLVSGLLLLVCTPLCACVDAQSLQMLGNKEMQYLLQRIPPAFADSVSDQLIQSHVSLKSADQCQVNLQLILPAADITEAQALLQAEPAKQIMLAAQGYQLPEQPQIEADYSVNPANLQPVPRDVLQTAALGKLRASVELMYAMLTQARANGQVPHSPWTAEELHSSRASCQQQYHADNSHAGCDCYIRGLAEKYSVRQVKYNRYLLSNPYAFATGNGGDFKHLDKALQSSCGLNL